MTSVAAPPHIRPVEREDRDRIQEIVVATGHFTQIEADTALELVDASLAGGEASGYLTYVLESPPGVVQGYVCIGPTPLTDGTFDLYWVAVDPAAQGRGYGRRLLATAEAEVRARGGRLVIIETSSQEIYRPTVGFYESAGYRLVARIPNFYRPGDDKLVFARDIAPA